VTLPRARKGWNKSWAVYVHGRTAKLTPGPSGPLPSDSSTCDHVPRLAKLFGSIVATVNPGRGRGAREG